MSQKITRLPKVFGRPPMRTSNPKPRNSILGQGGAGRNIRKKSPKLSVKGSSVQIHNPRGILGFRMGMLGPAKRHLLDGEYVRRSDHVTGRNIQRQKRLNNTAKLMNSFNVSLRDKIRDKRRPIEMRVRSDRREKNRRDRAIKKINDRLKRLSIARERIKKMMMKR